MRLYSAKCERKNFKLNNEFFRINNSGSLCWITYFLILNIFLLLMVVIIKEWTYCYTFTDVPVHHINLKSTDLRKTSTNFLSFGLDTSLLRNMAKFPIKNKKFINFARHLSPAFVRIGGTASDCLFFEKFTVENSQFAQENSTYEYNDSDITNFTISAADFESIYRFTHSSGLRMIFDLNVLIRNNDDSWNSSNARDIIKFANARGMDLDWQLGNEPNSFFHVFNMKVPAKQLAKDYYSLRLLLNNTGFSKSLLVGPEANHVADEKHAGEYYVKDFLDNEKSSISHVTWHQYYLNGRTATVDDFVNPSVFNYLPNQIDSLKSVIAKTGKNISMWLSETGSAYGGGAPELSNRFVAGFLWLDKLGYGASAGLDVIIRQSFYGGYYAMIANDLKPNPDWWISVLFKNFVSEKVLQIATSNNLGHIRFYGHCASRKVSYGQVSGITLYGMNLNDLSAAINLSGFLPVPNKKLEAHLYVLTSSDLQSSDIQLNGETLSLKRNGDLPDFHPITMSSMTNIILPPHSMIFIIIYNVENAPECFFN